MIQIEQIIRKVANNNFTLQAETEGKEEKKSDRLETPQPLGSKPQPNEVHELAIDI